MRLPFLLCGCVSPLSDLNAWTSLCETWYVYHGTWAHLSGVLHKSFLKVCVCVYPCIVARERLGTCIPTVTDTRSRKIVIRIVFCTVRVVSKESLYVCVTPPPPFWVLYIGAINKFRGQRKLLETGFLRSFRDVLKERRNCYCKELLAHDNTLESIESRTSII
jgi:hypothetical protein